MKTEGSSGFLANHAFSASRLPALRARKKWLTMVRYARTWFAVLALALVSFARAADVVSIWGGARGTIVLKSDGTVWTWGANFDGKLGIGDTNPVRTTVPVEVHGAGNAGYLNSVKTIMGC